MKSPLWHHLIFFSEINDPFFHYADPLDMPQTHKINIISIRLIPETLSCLLVYLINPEPFFYFPPNQTNSKPTSYFLPFSETSPNFLIIRLHFIEVSILHTCIVHIRFASYFLHTLWHLVKLSIWAGLAWPDPNPYGLVFYGPGRARPTCINGPKKSNLTRPYMGHGLGPGQPPI